MAINVLTTTPLNRPVSSVKDFGAVGDGVTDDSVAIQAGLDHLNSIGGGTLFFPGGLYVVGSQLDGHTKVSMISNELAVLDTTPGRSTYYADLVDPFISYTGSVGSALTVSSAISFQDKTLTLADTSSLTTGDLIEISENGENGDWVDTSVAVHIAELNIIASVDSGTQVTLIEPVREEYGYTTSAVVKKVTPIEDVTIKGLKFIGLGRDATATGDMCLGFYYGKNIRVQDCLFEGMDGRGILVVNCWNYLVDGNTLITDPQGANTSVNYAIVPTSCSVHGRITNNYCENWRHGVITSHLSTGLDPDYMGVNRDVLVSGNTIVNTWHAGIATHNDVEHIFITNNSLQGCDSGINVRDRNVTVQDNQIVGSVHAIIFNSRPQRVSVRGNRASHITGSFLTLSSIESGWDIEHIDISDNYSTDSVGGITLSHTGTTLQTGISIRGNHLCNLTGAGGSSAIIRIDGNFSCMVSNNYLSDGTSISGIRIENGVDYTQIWNNIIVNIALNAYSIDATIGATCYLDHAFHVGHDGSPVAGSANLAGFTNAINGGTSAI